MQTAKNTRTEKLIAVGAIVALAILSVQAYAYISTGSLNTVIKKASGVTDPTGNITVTGNGQVSVQADIAYLTIGVDTTASTATQAAQQNAAIMTNVISAIEALGINASSIQTISYNIYQQPNYVVQPSPIVCNGADNSTCVVPYSTVKSTSTTVTTVCSGADNDTTCGPPVCDPVNATSCGVSPGYEVDNEIQVTVSVTSQNISQLGIKVGQAIDAAVAAGANEVYGVQFTASNNALQQAYNEALQQAVLDASSQAKTIATALGVTVTGVVSVTTSPSYVPSPVLYASAGSSSQTPIVPQSLTVSASVQAVYAIS